MASVIGRMKDSLKRHAHHLVFGVSIFSLAFLVAWWSIFLNRSIEKQRALSRENLEVKLSFWALELGKPGRQAPGLGVLAADNRFEISDRPSPGDEYAKTLAPAWPGLTIRPGQAVLAEIDDEFRRKKLMLRGESWTLFLLVFLSSFLLYKFIQLERRSTREMEEFWGRVTHEIKTPITGVKAFLQSLKNRSLKEKQMHPFLDMALLQVEKQEQLAENILAGSGLGHKDAVLHLEVVDLEEFLERYFENHALYLVGAQVDLDLGKKEKTRVKADRHALKIILDNLTDNAAKYCSPGLVLQIAAFCEGDWGIIQVSDNGPGIPPEVSTRVFQAYKCLGGELPVASQGSGMGLCISKKLALKMGGDLVSGKEEKGWGARFRVMLPLE